MIKLSHGPTLLTINHGSTFMVTQPSGEIDPAKGQGLFADDTRFLSKYVITIDQHPWEWASSAATSYNCARIYLSQPELQHDELRGTSSVTRGDLGLTIVRVAGEGVHEELEVVNYSLKTVKVLLEIELASDFASLFEVKLSQLKQRANMVTEWSQASSTLSTSYTHRDFHCRFTYQVVGAGPAPSYANGRLVFPIQIEPQAHWRACGHMSLQSGGRVYSAVCVSTTAGEPREEALLCWKRQTTALSTPYADLQLAYEQSRDDMAALRLYDSDNGSSEVWVPAAGIPWFVTLFGRDTLIASLQSLTVDSTFAEGALRQLAAMQATVRDDAHDAQPGKILHEIRHDELAHFGLILQTPYYGTWDATPLFLIALWQTWKWCGNRKLVDELLPTIQGCLDWIDTYGDLDGDGFQEYETFAPGGYENMGWKDAFDAVVYPDGSQVKQPKATAELQGYVYAAKVGTAEIYKAWGDNRRAGHLAEEARELKRRFNAAFWLEDEGIYAFGLDPEKKPIRTVASNAGHCLWSGIVDVDKAPRLVKRLLADDMWSGWGIRTLSAKNPAYNPMSYQRGSVWPHDNGIIAMGMKRYGFHQEASRVVRAMLDASGHFPNYRLPELFAGFPRDPAQFPVRYPDANVPQAWAAGSIFHFVQALLGLDADAPNHKLRLNPTLPDFVPELKLERLQVGDAQLTLHFQRQPNGHTTFEVVSQSGADLEVVSDEG